ncbi:MAG: ankyrin repeat domain-containing protein [Candidatus Thorarchaeota archaeon]
MKPIDETLLKAAEEGDFVGVRKALEDGADVNATNDDFRDTAIHVASSKGHLEIVKFLIDSGADILALNGVDMTPIHLAVRDGHTQIVELFLDVAEEIPERLLSDMMHVGSMSVYGRPEIVDMLRNYRVAHATPSTDGMDEATAKLLQASHDGILEDVVDAIGSDADLEATDSRGMTALVWAALRGHLEIVRALLEKGANVNCINSAEWTPLMQAAAQGHLDIVNLLLENGANVNMKTFVSGTALIFASGEGHEEIVKVLLDKGADPSISISGTDTEDGMTALSYARRNGHTKIVEMLREEGGKGKGLSQSI